jgi:hypothetical protein
MGRLNGRDCLPVLTSHVKSTKLWLRTLNIRLRAHAPLKSFRHRLDHFPLAADGCPYANPAAAGGHLVQGTWTLGRARVMRPDGTQGIDPVQGAGVVSPDGPELAPESCHYSAPSPTD